MKPDTRWLPFLKMGFGFLLLLLLATLAAIIGLGKVEQTTSYGLQDILGGLLVLSGGYAQWAFHDKPASNPEEVKLNDKPTD